MGFITLEDATVVHTQALNPDPIIGVETIESKTSGGITYVTQILVHKSGRRETQTLSYPTYT